MFCIECVHVVFCIDCVDVVFWTDFVQSGNWTVVLYVCVLCFRLKTFVHESPEPLRIQLQTLLYPLFVNVYLELLQNAQTAAGGAAGVGQGYQGRGGLLEQGSATGKVRATGVEEGYWGGGGLLRQGGIKGM